jgi:hypothetical protein
MTLATLVANRVRIGRAALRSAGWAQIAVAICFLIVGAAIAFGAYLFFLRAFGRILAEDVVGALIVRYLLEASFAFTFFLGVASFIASSFSFFYRDEEVKLLAPMPIEPRTLFAYRFLGATLLSSWPVLALALPALVALGVALGAPLPYYAFAAVILVLFVAAVSVVGGLLSLLVAPLGRRLPAGFLSVLELAAFLAAGGVLVRTVIPRSVFRLFQATALEVGQAEERLTAMFAGMPSHPFASVAAAALPSSGVSSEAMTVALIAVSIVAGALALYVAADRFYLPQLQSFGENGFIARAEDAPSSWPGPRLSFPRIFRFGHGFLFEKDMIGLLRSGDELARAGFLLLLLLLYVLSARAVSLMEPFLETGAPAGALTFVYAAICYFSLTFGLRFVFPSLSLEGKSAWVIWSSPVHLHELYSWKFFFWSAIQIAAMMAVTFVIILLFGLPLPLAIALLFAVACAVASLVAITLGHGSLSPVFGVRDPDVASTSPSGLAATGVGIVYTVIACRYVNRVVTRWAAEGMVDSVALFGLLIVSLAVVIGYWIAAQRVMDRIEIS